jgi:hypothetical protein
LSLISKPSNLSKLSLSPELICPHPYQITFVRCCWRKKSPHIFNLSIGLFFWSIRNFDYCTSALQIQYCL